jgi:preprotein translocase subunit SecD
VQQPQFGGNASITGQFSEGEAKDLALALRYGALPIELEPQAVQTVSATLGKDSLHAGVIAGLVGVGLVLLFMLLYYRALGLVVFLGIAVSASLLWSIVCLLSETRGLALTLSGCAGIIVSIGVTVDSYVVYFERLKDEVRSGKSLRSSAERGFSSAYRTILAADGASLIGALLLYWLTVGSVRGFAFYLALSTLLDMVVAYFFTRPLVAILARKLKGANILGVRMGEALATADAGAIR